MKTRQADIDISISLAHIYMLIYINIYIYNLQLYLKLQSKVWIVQLRKGLFGNKFHLYPLTLSAAFIAAIYYTPEMSKKTAPDKHTFSARIFRMCVCVYHL